MEDWTGITQNNRINRRLLSTLWSSVRLLIESIENNTLVDGIKRDIFPIVISWKPSGVNKIKHHAFDVKCVHN